jgi:hypothetical protein
MIGTGLASGLVRNLGGGEDTLGGDGRFLVEGTEEVEEVADLTIGQLSFHVLLVSILMVVGKMFPICCYRKEANIRGEEAEERSDDGENQCMFSAAHVFCGACFLRRMFSAAHVILRQA